MAVKYGIDFPFRESVTGDYLMQTYTPERDVRANLIHLILTKKGRGIFYLISVQESTNTYLTKMMWLHST